LEKLDLEIGYRLSTAISQLEQLDSVIQGCLKAAERAEPCKRAQGSLDAIFTSRATQPTMFPEFSLYSTLALVAELKRIAPGSEQKPLKEVIKHISAIYTMLHDAKAPLDQPKLVAKAILDKVVLPRWQQGFYYLDCKGRDHPFC
jgi:hypothetical protein